MVNAVSQLADRLLVRFVPQTVASAACKYYWSLCYCSGGLRYSKRCFGYCPGVPRHCSACQVVGTC